MRSLTIAGFLLWVALSTIGAAAHAADFNSPSRARPSHFTNGTNGTRADPSGQRQLDAAQAVPLIALSDPLVPQAPPASPAEIAPDALLSAATLVVTTSLKENKNLQRDNPAKFNAIIEATILPLFDFRHMTQLAVARNWRLASADQQTSLVVEFRALLVRTYSTALVNYRDQAIAYKPLRVNPGETAVTVKSTVRQRGAERLSIDYDMEKTPGGWKVYDIKIGGISLITTYRSNFAQTIRDEGVDGLIRSLAEKNLLGDAGQPTRDGARPALFMYSVMPAVLQGRQ